MDVFQCVSTLSSIRNFKDSEVPADLVKEVLEAGRLSPSAHNDQPWKFILINDRDRINEVQKFCLSGSFVKQSSFVVVILTDKSSKWYQVDGTRAAQNMILTAWSHGIGTCWIGRIDNAGLSEYLKIPDQWHILTVLPFGYFDKKLVPSSKFRKSGKEVFYKGEFGKPVDFRVD